MAKCNAMCVLGMVNATLRWQSATRCVGHVELWWQLGRSKRTDPHYAPEPRICTKTAIRLGWGMMRERHSSSDTRAREQQIGRKATLGFWIGLSLGSQVRNRQSKALARGIWFYWDLQAGRVLGLN